MEENKNNIPETYEVYKEVFPIRDEIKKLLERKPEEKIDIDFEHPSPELEELFSLNDRLEKLMESINTADLTTIDNLDAIKSQFQKDYLAGHAENPVFTYQNNLSKFKNKLAENNLDLALLSEEVEKIYQQARSLKLKHSQKLEHIARFALLKIIRENKANLALARGLETQDENLIKQSLSERHQRQVGPDLLTTAEKLYQNLLTESSNQTANPVTEQSQKIDEATPPSTPDGVNELNSLPPEKRKFYFNSEEIKQAFDFVLEEYKKDYEERTGQPLPIENQYEVKILDNIPNITVRHKTHEIRVPRNRIVSAQKLIGLCAHEIEGHILQVLNGKKLRIGQGGLKTGDQVLSEGLAVYLEKESAQKLFQVDEKPSSSSLYYIFAINLAEQGKSFVEIFEEIYKKESALLASKQTPADKIPQKAASTAWNVTYRILSGHLDSSNKNSFSRTKDRVYLEGYLLQKQLVSLDLDHLNSTVPMQQKALALVNRLNLSPDKLPFPPLNISEKYFHEKILPRLQS